MGQLDVLVTPLGNRISYASLNRDHFYPISVFLSPPYFLGNHGIQETVCLGDSLPRFKRDINDDESGKVPVFSS